MDWELMNRESDHWLDRSLVPLTLEARHDQIGSPSQHFG
jgi:hypothetical protein